MHWFILSYVSVFYPTLGWNTLSVQYPRILHTKYYTIPLMLYMYSNISPIRFHSVSAYSYPKCKYYCPTTMAAVSLAGPALDPPD